MNRRKRGYSRGLGRIVVERHVATLWRAMRETGHGYRRRSLRHTGRGEDRRKDKLEAIELGISPMERRYERRYG